jgi:cell division septum initiation protein DivIVA
LKSPNFFSEIKVSLETSIGKHMKTEIDKLLDNLESMISSFDDHFKDLKSQVSNLEANID